jgi:hypothetical protein
MLKGPVSGTSLHLNRVVFDFFAMVVVVCLPEHMLYKRVKGYRLRPLLLLISLYLFNIPPPPPAFSDRELKFRVVVLGPRGLSFK